MNSSLCDSSLRDRLVRDNRIIQSIIDTIPPKYYFDKDVLDKLEEAKVKTGNEETRGLHPRNRFGVKAKHKRLRLNPFHQKTVSQIVGELEEKDKNNVEHPLLSSKGNIEELQQRLRQKIQAMSADRQGNKNKQAQRVKRNIAKLKQKEKRKKKKYSGSKLNVESSADSKNENPQKMQPSPNIFNKEGKLIYSKFDLGASNLSPREKTPKSSLKRSMMEIKQKEQKIQKLEKESSEKAEEFKNKNLWQQALNKSEGRKVKDNPELLKKSLKRQEQRKKKSRKQWQHRNDQVQKKKQEAQDKRKKNILNRKNDKLNNKLKKAAKKGRLIPGF